MHWGGHHLVIHSTVGIGQNDQLTFVVGDEVFQPRSAALHQLWGFEGVAGAQQVHLQGQQLVMR